MTTGDPGSARALRPLRRLALPGGRTLLRAGLVAVLLGLAAAILHTPTGCPPTDAAESSPTRSGGAGTEPLPASGPTDGVKGRTGAGQGQTGAGHGQTGTAQSGAGQTGTAQTGAGQADAGAGDGGAQASSGPLPLPSGAVGVPIRLAEPAALAVVRPGARVDLLAAPPGGADAAEAILLAPRALVLDVLGAGATDGTAALYLALRPDQAQRAVGLPEGSRFAIVVRA
ncbi:flagellar biosynthesis protein FlgA [Micromonospora sp. NPDC000316]|uniref:flagellar biosynthesis protein FlgA n=1 Tax=Micromonospora sp. NPDC000316 TaxID=3364216 RepID=UPI0036C72A41